MAKERRHVLDVGALGHERAFVAAEEVDAVVNVGVEEDVGRAERQAAAEREVLPVVACAERPEQRDGRAGDDAEADGVTGTHERGGLFDTHLSRLHRQQSARPRSLCDDLEME